MIASEKSIDEVYRDNTTKIKRFDNQLGNLANQYFKIINEKEDKKAHNDGDSSFDWVSGKYQYVTVEQLKEFGKLVLDKYNQLSLNDGIYNGLDDNSCNYGITCNDVIKRANSLYVSQAINGDYDIEANQQIINNSLGYAFNLALLNSSPKVYQALKDTKNQAYQKAQLGMLTDIDQQLRTLNTSLTAKTYRGG